MNTNNWKILKPELWAKLSQGICGLMMANCLISGPVVLGQSDGISETNDPDPVPIWLSIIKAAGVGIDPAENAVQSAGVVGEASAAATALEEKRIYLGVLLSDVSPALRAQLNIRKNTGVLVEKVMDNSPASKAGIRQYDILTHIDDQILVNNEHLVSLLSTFEAGASVKVHYRRQANPGVVVVELEEKSFAVVPPYKEPAWEEDQTLLFDKPSGNPIRLEVDPTVPMDALVKILHKQMNQEIPMQSGMQKTRMFNDGQRMVTLSGRDGEMELTVKERTGTIIYQGPVGSDEAYLKEIPEIHREAVKRYVDKFGRPTEDSKVPLLTDLPVIGKLFDASSKNVCIRHLQKLGIQAVIHKDQYNIWPEKPEHFGLSSLEAETITCPGNGSSKAIVRDTSCENAAELHNKHKIFDYIIHRRGDKESDVENVILECPLHKLYLYRDGSVQSGSL